MKADIEGFLYPCIDKNICIDCGLCNKVCPINKADEMASREKDMPLEAYAVRNRNSKVLDSSSSGGFFSVIAEYVTDKEGYVFGACYDEDFNVFHAGTFDQTKINGFRTSKYVQSNLSNAFSETKYLLENKKLVCFSGTPCQIEGLKSFLGKNYDNLITVDLVCHGVPSPKLWRKYLLYQEDKYHLKITSVNFRKKTYGYHAGILELVFANGEKYYGSVRNDGMVKSFFSEIASRPSCYKCKFKYAKHNSDFTLFDCWHANKLVDRLIDDDRGFTNVFVQSEKGKNILAKISENLILYPVEPEKAIQLDGPMVRNSAIPHKNRTQFYQEMDQTSLQHTVQRFIPITLKDRMIVSLRDFCHKLGILAIARRFSQRVKI